MGERGRGTFLRGACYLVRLCLADRRVAEGAPSTVSMGHSEKPSPQSPGAAVDEVGTVRRALRGDTAVEQRREQTLTPPAQRRLRGGESGPTDIQQDYAHEREGGQRARSTVFRERAERAWKEQFAVPEGPVIQETSSEIWMCACYPC